MAKWKFLGQPVPDMVESPGINKEVFVPLKNGKRLRIRHTNDSRGLVANDVLSLPDDSRLAAVLGTDPRWELVAPGTAHITEVTLVEV